MAPLRSDACLDLSFVGRFGFGIDQWAYVPFDVPAGIRRIDVSTSHDTFSLLGIGHNVLDLGIFGPAGHELGNARGSAAGREARGRASCCPRPTRRRAIWPDRSTLGRWALALGPVVLNPLGMDWRAQIVLKPGVQPSIRHLAEPKPPTHSSRGARWYRGDLHTHTVHSDGRRQLAEMADAAVSAGLDFIVSTEHNTNSANRAWTVSACDELDVIAGEEVTTRHGHWLAVGLPPGGWVDWRYGPRDNLFAGYAARVRAEGGFVVAAHPSVPLPGCAWEFGFRDVDAIEVWNGMWNVDDEVSLRIWHQLLRQGRRVTAVGGSDSHISEQPVGSPQTVVYAQDSSTPALIAALRGGHCYIAESSAITLALNVSREGGHVGHRRGGRRP